MFAAARWTDFVTHDQVVPSGVIAPPLGPPGPGGLVLVEGRPAAHRTCSAVCTGVVSTGVAHPPAPGPPPPISTGSPTVLINSWLAARWMPSGDIAACLALLGDARLLGTRTVFIGNGALTVSLRVVIIAGTAWDSSEGRERIADQIVTMTDITGIAVQVTEVVTVDADEYATMVSRGPWDGTRNYTGGEALEALDRYGDPDVPTAIYTDELQRPNGDPLRGFTVSNAWAGSDDSIPHEGIVVDDSADPETTTHEMGHLLSGETDDLHSDDPDNLMHPFGDGDAWSDPWRSSTERSPHVRPE